VSQWRSGSARHQLPSRRAPIEMSAWGGPRLLYSENLVRQGRSAAGRCFIVEGRGDRAGDAGGRSACRGTQPAAPFVGQFPTRQVVPVEADGEGGRRPGLAVRNHLVRQVGRPAPAGGRTSGATRRAPASHLAPNEDRPHQAWPGGLLGDRSRRARAKAGISETGCIGSERRVRSRRGVRRPLRLRKQPTGATRAADRRALSRRPGAARRVGRSGRGH